MVVWSPYLTPKWLAATVDIIDFEQNVSQKHLDSGS